MRGFATRVRAGVDEAAAATRTQSEEMSAAATSTATATAEASAGMFARLKEQIKGVAAFALPAIGAIEAFKFVKDSVAAAREEEKQLRQTAAVIKSTGGAAHVTAGDVEELAKVQSEHTGITQTQIRASENLLLTFRGIRNEVGKGNDIFNQATQAVLDTSVAMNESAKSAAIQLGKALNDPVLGMTALRRIGVSFSKTQQDMVKGWIAHGQQLRAQKFILAEINHEFGHSAEAQATAGAKMSASWEAFKVEMGDRLLPVIDAVENFFSQKLLPGIEHLFEEAGKGKGVLATLGNVFKALWAVLVPLVHEVIDLGRQAWPYVQRALAQIEPLLESTAKFIREHGTLVRTLTVAIIAFWAAWKGYKILMAVRDAILAVNVAIDANPIAAIISLIIALAAALVYAYKHSKTFRDIVNQVWDDVKGFFIAAWHVIKAVINALVTAWQYTWHALQAAWRNVGHPIFEVIKVVFKVWYAIVGGILLAYIAAWKGVWFLAKWAWNNIGHPIFEIIKAVFKVWWAVVSTIFKLYIDAWKAVWHVAQAIWNAVGRPVFNIVTGTVKALWHALQPIFKAIGNAWSDLWDNMSHAFSSIWNGIEGAIIHGINAVIHVINFFIRAIDWVLDKLPGNLHINTLSTFSLGGGGGGGGGGGHKMAFAAGGITPGDNDKVRPGYVFPGYTPGRDIWKVPSYWFSGGEGIIRPEAVRALGGAAGLKKFNEMFTGRALGNSAAFGRFADTGPLSPGQINKGLKGTTHEFGGTGVGFGFGALLSDIGKPFKEVVSLIRKGTAWVLGKALTAAEFPFKEAVYHLPSGILRDVGVGGFNWVDHGIRALIAKIGGEARKKAAAARRVGSIPAGEHLALIKHALSLAGAPVDAADIADVNTIINYESGWDPNAINRSDSNFAAGDPSRGLMQTIMTTFEAYRLRNLSNNIYDPLSNIVAGIRYAISTYGNLGNVPGIVSLARGGGYVGYETGTLNVPRDQTARVHKGEMILPKKLADIIRRILRHQDHGGAWHGGDFVRGAQMADLEKILHRMRHPHHAARQFTTAKGAIKQVEEEWKSINKTMDDFQKKGVKSVKDVRQAFRELNKEAEIHHFALRELEHREERMIHLIQKRNDLTHQISKTQADLNNLTKSYKDEVNSIHGNILGTFDITSAGAGMTDTRGNPAKISAKTILVQLGATIANAKMFARLLKKVAKEGLNRILVGQLAAAGPAAMAQLQALADATPKQISMINSDYRTLGNYGTAAGVTAGHDLFHERLARDRHRLHREERRLRIDEHQLARAVAEAFKGLEISFDADGQAHIVTKHQSTHHRKGVRR
jgi:SLT domain-containing protein/phage-related protein